MRFVPERLKELRILNGYTLETVAEKIGVTKQAVSKYEVGKAIPATNTIIKILKLYGVDRRYLTNQRELPKEKSIIFYRKKVRTPQRDKEEAQIYLKRFYEIIAVAEQVYPIKKLDIPCFSADMSISDKAFLLRTYWKIGEEPIKNIVELLEEHGFYLFTAEMQGEKIDGYSQIIGNIPIIVLNGKKGTKSRNCFSIAHELGHLIMHRNLKTESDKMEEEADEFAACFLMPENALKADLVRNDAPYFLNLALKWKVSPQALAQRYRRLQLLGRNRQENDAKLTYLYQYFSKEREKIIKEEKTEVCSIRNVLLKIEAEDKIANKFLYELSFPVKEIQKFCCWADGFSKYKQFIDKDVDEIEGVQLSFVF